ncbi:MAG: flavin reductase family protein [Planctomycetota bacterium]|jgi:flavin reductase (DIM6/NTAB) family NADH-FMN oxidoreductase RutF
MADPSPLAKALGRIPSGLFIVTAGTGDQATGFLASFVQQVGLEPPVLSVAVKAERPAAQLIRDHGAFCVAVIDEASKHLMGHYARGFEPGQPAFEGIESVESSLGVPYPSDALAVLGCKFVGEVAWTDHILFAGEAVEGHARDESDPMIHLRKNGLSY